MIFFGQKASVLRTETAMGLKCEHCGNSGTVTFGIAGKYGHVYWIPFIPMGKTCISSCTHCKQTLQYQEMSTQMRTYADELMRETKTPLWFFSGIGVVIALVAIFSYFDQTDNAEDREILQSPQAGDKYSLKTGLSEYTMHKVIRVAGDSVFFAANQMVVNKMRGLYKIDKEENYIDMGDGCTKAELLQKFEKGEIYEVSR